MSKDKMEYETTKAKTYGKKIEVFSKYQKSKIKVGNYKDVYKKTVKEQKKAIIQFKIDIKRAKADMKMAKLLIKQAKTTYKMNKVTNKRG